MYPRDTTARYPIHRDTNAVLASAVIPIQDSGIGLLTERYSNLILAAAGDIAWIGPNTPHRVWPIGSDEDRKSIVINF